MVDFQFEFIYPLLSAASFAISSVIIRKLEPLGSPSLLNLYRTVIGAVIFLINLVIINLVGDLFSIPIKIIFFLILSVVFNVVIGDTLYFAAQNVIGVKIATPIINTFPLFTIIFAIIFLEETISIEFIIGGIIIIIGIILLSVDIREPIHSIEKQTLISQKSTIIALLFTFITVICYTLGVIFTTIATKSLDPVVANSIRLPFGSLFLGMLYFTQVNYQNSGNIKRKEISNKSNNSSHNQNQGVNKLLVLQMLIAGILGTYFASLYLVLSVQTLGAGKTAVLTSTGPLFALPLAIIWLKEKVGIITITGTILTIIGLWVILI